MRKTLIILLGTLILSGLASAHGMSEADQLRAVDGGIVEFLRQGAVHMITGYDHLLFLFGVVFFLTKFKDIVKFVTAFTLGHSITLIAATFMGIQANYYLIDAVIALTVCYKGFDNLDGFKKYFKMKSPNLVGMVFIFGLIHGFGLSTRLQTLTIGEGMDLLGKIIAFNVGVEAGQIAALVTIIAVLAGIRHTQSFQRFSTAANAFLIIIGGLLLLMQLHSYSHQHDPMGFFDEKAHKHQHEDMGMGGGGDHHTPTISTNVGGETYSTVIDRIFETRKALKSAQTDDEILDAHHPASSIYKDLVLLQGMVKKYSVIDHDKIAEWMKDATTTAKLIDEEAHGGNVETIKGLIQRFDKSILAIEELINHPVIPDAQAIPEGHHVDKPGGAPHKDH